MRTQTTAEAIIAGQGTHPGYGGYGMGPGMGMGMGMGMHQLDPLDQLEITKRKMKEYNFIGIRMLRHGDMTLIIFFFILWVGLAIGCIFTKIEIKSLEENLVIDACIEQRHEDINIFTHPKIIALLVASYLCAILSMGCFAGFIIAIGLAF